LLLRDERLLCDCERCEEVRDVVVGGDGFKLRLEEDGAEEPGCWSMTLPLSELLLELSLVLKDALDLRRRLRFMWSFRKDGMAVTALGWRGLWSRW
jgi:hypothetical protein